MNINRKVTEKRDAAGIKDFNGAEDCQWKKNNAVFPRMV